MIGAHQPEKRRRGRLLITARWLAAIAVLGILLHFLPLHPLSEAIQQVPLTRFIIILIGYLLAHAVGVAKWRMVVNAAGAQLDFRTSAQCYAGGLFATLFLPSIIGGDVVRLAVGLRRSPNPAAVLAGNVADRFLDMSAQAGLVLLGICFCRDQSRWRCEIRRGMRCTSLREPLLSRLCCWAYCTGHCCGDVQ